jgi:hypothetical protein
MPDVSVTGDPELPGVFSAPGITVAANGVSLVADPLVHPAERMHRAVRAREMMRKRFL